MDLGEGELFCAGLDRRAQGRGPPHFQTLRVHAGRKTYAPGSCGGPPPLFPRMETRKRLRKNLVRLGVLRPFILETAVQPRMHTDRHG